MSDKKLDENVLLGKGKIDMTNFHAIIDDPLVLVCTTSKRCDTCKYLKACSAIAEVYKDGNN